MKGKTSMPRMEFYCEHAYRLSSNGGKCPECFRWICDACDLCLKCRAEKKANNLNFRRNLYVVVTGVVLTAIIGGAGWALSRIPAILDMIP